jgi:glycosyltransferase involved in cell wall biosynthesis
MRILLISFWFPTTNRIGAVRVGKLAKYLHQAGHDVHVLAGPEVDDLSLPLEVPMDIVIRPPAHAQSQGADLAPRALEPLRRLMRGRQNGILNLEAALQRHYRALRQFPDKRNGWFGQALSGGRSLMPKWRPDLMIASSPPCTALLVAARLSKEFGIPWVAELRDPWANNPYNDEPGWRLWCDRFLERRTLRSCAAVVTVSPVVGDEMRQRYAKPTATFFNGYSEEDVVATPPRPPSDVLSIVYTGTIYVGLRDPSALFEAISLLRERRNRVKVVFYGPSEHEIRPAAEHFGVWDRVSVLPSVAYRQALEHQAAADVLLLLQRNHVTDKGNVPAKFFEYLGARRPILMLGYEPGIIATMIRERKAGFVGNEPAAIAARLCQWLDQLPRGIPPLPQSVLRGLSRSDQFAAYEAFLRTVVAGAAAPVTS